MVDERVYLIERVYQIAEADGINKTTVLGVINTYLDTLRCDLLSGRKVHVLGVFTVSPNVVVDPTTDTSAMYAVRVSDKLGVSYYTCLSIINTYLDSLRDELSNGLVVSMRGIVTIKPISDDGFQSGFHASISQSIKRDLKKLDSEVTSVRVHTHKLLKNKVKRSVESVC